MAAVLKAIVIVFGFLCITAPLTCYVWFREMMWPVAAYHVMDIPKDRSSQLALFGRASWSIPILWLLSALLIIVETAMRKRWRFLLIYAAVPFIGGAIYWVAWQGYLISIGHEIDDGTELKRHVTQDHGPHWLFVPHGHVDLGAEEVRLIGEWLTAHHTGWKRASVLDFSPSKTQFLMANCVIEVDGNRVVVTYMRDESDNDSAVYIQRSISPGEQSFWNWIVTAAKSTNQPVQRTGWPP